MKKLNKVLVLVLSTIMVLAMSASVFAAKTTSSGGSGSASITITLPTDNSGKDDEITYKVYKVFNATNDGSSSAIAYQIDSVNGDLSDDMIAAGFSVDSAGNVTFDETKSMVTTGDPTDAAIAAVAAYAKDEIGSGFKAKPSDGTLTITGLDYGYYYITTTTGSLVTIDSTNPNAEVNDKNSIPEVDKKITGASSYDEDGKKALAQVGTNVEFTATITVGKGAVHYVFHDVMSAGLSYNNDAAVTGVAADKYTIKDTPDAGDTITITFDDGIPERTKITIKYTAEVTSDALQDNPANNTASLSYGDNHRTKPVSTDVYNAKFTVTKNQPAKEGDTGAVLNEDDGKYYKPLAGAGFVLKNADGKYYKIENNVVSWVDNINNATEYKSDAQGAVPSFTGLADGTYTLVEKTVPAGYNKAEDTPFTIAKGNYKASNLKQETTVTNNTGTELPATGGIGTTIFYILGSLLVVGCGIVLVSRKRMQNKK